jgi:hypothetical protein
MKTKGTSRSSVRPEEFSESHGDVRTATMEPAQKRLRSVNEILEERLERRANHDDSDAGDAAENGEGMIQREASDQDSAVVPVDESDTHEAIVEERK